MTRITSNDTDSDDSTADNECPKCGDEYTAKVVKDGAMAATVTSAVSPKQTCTDGDTVYIHDGQHRYIRDDD